MFGRLMNIWDNQSIEVKMLGRGLFWTMSGSILSRGVLFLAWILVARILGKEHYGEYGLIRNTVLMFATFAGAGMGQAATKFVAEFINKDKKKAERIAALVVILTFITAVVVFIAALFLAPLIADNTMHAPWLANDFRVAAFILLFSTINSVQIGILEGLGLFKKVAFINSINAVVSFPIFVVGAYWGGVLGSVIAYGLSIVVICLMSGWQIGIQKRLGFLRLNYKEAWKERKLIYVFILPAILSGIAVMPLKWVADVMLANNSGFGELGTFSAALTINMIILGIAATFNSPFLTIIARYKGKNNMRVEKLNVFGPWFIGIIMTLPFLCFPQLGGLLFGKEYDGVLFRTTFVYILLFTIILMYKQGLSRILVIYNLQWFGLLSNILWGVIIIVMFLQLKSMGAIGLSISYLIAYFFTLIMMYPIYLRRKYISLDMVISMPIFLIWAILLFTSYISLLDINIPFRVLMLGISIIIIVFSFKMIFKTS